MRHDNLRLSHGSSGRRARVVFICGAAIGLLLGASQPAVAVAEVLGHQHDLRVRVENASVREVLDALSAKFILTYKLSSNLNRVLTGRYSGTLQQILTRVLDGTDYIVGTLDGRIEIVVFGPSRTTAIASHPQLPAPMPAPRINAVKAAASPPKPPPLNSFLSAREPVAKPAASGSP